MYNESKHVQVTGRAVAVSGGGGGPVDILQWQGEAIFTEVPKGQKLVITDVLVFPQGSVSQVQTVNLAIDFNGPHDILLQLKVQPGQTAQAHFHTGFVVTAGFGVSTFTDANPPAGQHFSIIANGYLARVKKKRRP